MAQDHDSNRIEDDDADFKARAARLMNLPKSEAALRREAIAEEVAAETPRSKWVKLSKYADADPQELAPTLQRVAVEMRYRLLYPASKSRNEERVKYFNDLKEFADLIEALVIKFKEFAYRNNDASPGFASLWERFADYNENYYARSRPRARRQEILEISISEFPGLLEVLRIATFDHERELPNPVGPGRPRFPETTECAQSAVTTWLRARWDRGIRGKDLVPTQRNGGTRFVTELLELGFKATPRSDITLDKLAKATISNLRRHVIAVSNFIEAEQAAGLDTRLHPFSFQVHPFDAYRRFMVAQGTPIDE
ncbi:MAG: hypothetical protein CMF75_02385 [Maricaulis sp.]|nr:hypothetical protein [Maricaulis sp.]